MSDSTAAESAGKPGFTRRRFIIGTVGASAVTALAGTAPYLVAVGVAFVSAYASLAICAAIAVFYALPIASGYESRSG